MDMPSAYNIILGQPALNDFQVVVSTYHMKLKFSARARVGKLIDNQYTRKCYVKSVRGGSKKDMEVNLPQPSREKGKRLTQHDEQGNGVPARVQPS
ncbi:UNVERIFIED_CONTAM: hypothetical protein Sradi_3148400 [Sesamum radiatum]|uniref:Uncharacterized protein n=1 Tax=Sesamum radiatum TaxID=300843 RepID=A0AAW2REF6_SESRA